MYLIYSVYFNITIDTIVLYYIVSYCIIYNTYTSFISDYIVLYYILFIYFILFIKFYQYIVAQREWESKERYWLGTGEKRELVGEKVHKKRIFSYQQKTRQNFKIEIFD